MSAHNITGKRYILRWHPDNELLLVIWDTETDTEHEYNTDHLPVTIAWKDYVAHLQVECNRLNALESE